MGGTHGVPDRYYMELVIYKMSMQFSNIFAILAVLFTFSMGQLVVDRSNEGLTAVPVDIDPEVTILNLNINFIRRIEEGDMGNLYVLEKLNLDDNGLTFISAKAFINNTYLAILRFTGHKFSSIPAELGGAWQNVRQIICAGAQIDMQPLTLAYLPALTIVGINTNPIKNLTLGHLPSLVEIRAIDCNLETFPNLSAVPSLEKVQLSNNYFTTIPPYALDGLTKLTYLVFNDGRLHYVPDLSHLSSLRSLSMQRNALMSLPDLYDMSSLKKVRLV